MSYENARQLWSESASREELFRASGRQPPDKIQGVTDPDLSRLMTGISVLLLLVTQGDHELALELYRDLVSGYIPLEQANGKRFDFVHQQNKSAWCAVIRRTAWRELRQNGAYHGAGERSSSLSAHFQERHALWQSVPCVDEDSSHVLLSSTGRLTLWMACFDTSFTGGRLFEAGFLKGNDPPMFLVDASLVLRRRLQRFDPTGHRTFRLARLVQQRRERNAK